MRNLQEQIRAKLVLNKTGLTTKELAEALPEFSAGEVRKKVKALTVSGAISQPGGFGKAHLLQENTQLYAGHKTARKLVEDALQDADLGLPALELVSLIGVSYETTRKALCLMAKKRLVIRTREWPSRYVYFPHGAQT